MAKIIANPIGQVIEQLSQQVAREVKSGLNDDDSQVYNYSGGILTGIERTLTQVYGMNFDWDDVNEDGDPKDNSVSKQVLERGKNLRKEWDAIADDLNGSYLDVSGNRVEVSSGFVENEDRYVRYYGNGGPRGYDVKIMSNDLVRELIRHKLLVKNAAETPE